MPASCMHTPPDESIHAKSKSGYFSTRRYRNPPSPPPPIFWTLSIGEDTLLGQVCDSYASLVQM